MVEWYKVREVWRILQIDVRQRVDRKHSEDGRSVEALCCSHQASYCSSGFKQPFLTSTSCTTTTGSRSPALVLDPDWCSTCGFRAASNKESRQLGTAACGQCLVLAGFDGDVFILLFHLLFLVWCWIKHFLGLIHFLVLAPEWVFFCFFLVFWLPSGLHTGSSTACVCQIHDLKSHKSNWWKAWRSAPNATQQSSLLLQRFNWRAVVFSKMQERGKCWRSFFHQRDRGVEGRGGGAAADTARKSSSACFSG